VRVTPHQGGRESRLQGEGVQVSRTPKAIGEKQRDAYGSRLLGVNPPQFGARPIKYNPNKVIEDKKFVPYVTRNELVRRLTANVCELCGSTENIKVHHVRALKDVQKKYKGRQNPPDWAKFMMERRRKTIVVCHECHKKIHEGKYDGKRVGKDLLESRILGNL